MFLLLLLLLLLLRGGWSIEVRQCSEVRSTGFFRQEQSRQRLDANADS
jgi:hypothetical protein